MLLGCTVATEKSNTVSAFRTLKLLHGETNAPHSLPRGPRTLHNIRAFGDISGEAGI